MKRSANRYLNNYGHKIGRVSGGWHLQHAESSAVCICWRNVVAVYCPVPIVVEPMNLQKKVKVLIHQKTIRRYSSDVRPYESGVVSHIENRGTWIPHVVDGILTSMSIVSLILVTLHPILYGLVIEVIPCPSLEDSEVSPNVYQNALKG